MSMVDIIVNIPPQNCLQKFQKRNNYRYHNIVYLNISCLISLCIAFGSFITIPLAHSQDVAGLPPMPDLSHHLSDHNNDRLAGKCEACKALVKSFDQGMDATARGKHEGGDTSWEEKNLKSYADSEVRLVEIQEQLCLDLKEGKAECLALAEDTEGDVEEWWFKHRTKSVRLTDFLCISRLKLCCPEGKFGLNCQACPKDCGKNGKCSGSGTRQGDGSCQCDSGFTGELCQICAEGFYAETSSSIDNNDESMPVPSTIVGCLKCDQACASCTGPGPLECQTCAKGYKIHNENGCVDINECDGLEPGDENKRDCQGNTYCLNTEGSSKCQECHKSCKGCYGFGATMCIECATGYESYGNSCLKEGTRQQSSWMAEFSNPTSNYYMYLLAFLVAIIIFNQNLKILAFFSMGLIIVVTLAETNKGLPSIDTQLPVSS